MRTLKIADAGVMHVAILQEFDPSEESRYDYRLHGVVLVASGRSCTAMSQVFGEDTRTCAALCVTVRAPRCRVAGRPKLLDTQQ